MYYNEPVKVLVETNFIRAVEGGVGFVKASGNYGRSLFPTKLAQQRGYHQIVWTDARNHRYLEESGTMNLMFVIDDVGDECYQRQLDRPSWGNSKSVLYPDHRSLTILRSHN